MSAVIGRIMSVGPPLAWTHGPTPMYCPTFGAKNPHSKSAMPLRFRCYIDPEGNDVIKEWYDDSDEAIQGAFLGIVENLQRKSSPVRNENIFKAPQKRHASNCLGLHEILIDDDGRHYRIIGALEENIFTMLWTFYKNFR